MNAARKELIQTESRIKKELFINRMRARPVVVFCVFFFLLVGWCAFENVPRKKLKLVQIPCWHFVCCTFGSIAGISVATPGNCKMKGHRPELYNFREIFQRATMMKKQTAEFVKSVSTLLETHSITYLILYQPFVSELHTNWRTDQNVKAEGYISFSSYSWVDFRRSSLSPLHPFIRVDTTRVEFTISLRENWSLPFLALQVTAVTCYLRPQLTALQQVRTDRHCVDTSNPPAQ